MVFSNTALEIICPHEQIRELRTKPRNQPIVRGKGVVGAGAREPAPSALLASAIAIRALVR